MTLVCTAVPFHQSHVFQNSTERVCQVCHFNAKLCMLVTEERPSVSSCCGFENVQAFKAKGSLLINDFYMR